MATFSKIWKNADLKRKILFTLMIFVVYRIGIFIPVPGVNTTVLREFMGAGAIFGFLDAFSGGALQGFSVFAMGISPYINASIIVQLLQMDVIPILSEWQKEGESGKRKTNQLTRYLSLILAFIQGLAIAIGFNAMMNGIFLEGRGWLLYIYIALILTAGTAIMLFLADQITAKGIGNGTSMIIVAGIVTQIPRMIEELYRYYLVNLTFTNVLAVIAIVALILLTVIGVVYLQLATRKLPIQYANRHNSAQLSGRKDSFIPLKLNSAGVIPVIFASTFLSLPLTIVQFFPESGFTNVLLFLFDFNSSWLALLIYVLLIVGFTYFYAFVQVSPEKVAENLKKQGSYIPGVRPGGDTEEYLSKVLSRITFIGALSLVAIAALPVVLGMLTDIPASIRIGGTTILIVVGVAIETAKQIQTKTMDQRYQGFIK